MLASRTKRSISPVWLSVLLLLIALSALTQAIAASPETPHIVATINGQTITQERFEEEVRLKQMKLALANRSAKPNEADLLNRIIADTLTLQAANSTGLFIDPALVEAEIRLILGRSQVTRAEMELLLDGHDLTWHDFERSVWEYVKMSHFLTELLLADISQGKQDYLESWMSEQFHQAELSFDQAFLARINAPAPSIDF